MKTLLIFVAAVITWATTAVAQDWQRVPYPEFKPYTSNIYCRNDAQGNIWIDGGTSDNGKIRYSAIRFDASTEKWIEFSQLKGNLPNDSTIQRSISHSNGGLIAITPTALYVQSSASWNRIPYPEVGSHTSPVLTIDISDVFEDRDGNIWLLRNLSFNGINISNVSRYNGAEWTSWCADLPFYSYKGVNTNQFRSYASYSSIKQALSGDIWIVGSNGFVANPDSAGKYEMGGIARWDGKEWKFWTKKIGVQGNGLNDKVNNFAIDDKDRLIIAQAELKSSPFISGGVTMFENGAFTFYRQDNGSIPTDTALGLPGIRVGSVIVNDRLIAMDVAIRGTSWYFNTQYHGILEFNGTQWRSIANKTNGLITTGINGGFSIAIDKNGDIWASVIFGDIIRLRKTTSSVSEDYSAQNLILSPNPASTILRLTSHTQGEALTGTMTIVNALGAEILQIPASETIDINTLNQGTYFLRGYRGTTPFTIPFVIAR
jgi:hypothetical protein